MKRSKIIALVLGGVIFLAVVACAVCIGLRVAPAVNQTMRISKLLQPVIEAENQTMRIGIQAEVNSKTITLESDVYMLTEENTKFLALEQKGIALYITDNILLLENGKAFKLGEKMQIQTSSYEELLPLIGAMYDVLKITAEETDDCIVYEITVTGEQVDTLLAAASVVETLPVKGIETLNLILTEKNGKLDQICFSGNGELDGATVSLNVEISGFRVLAAGDHPIPDAVKRTAATVDPDTLFSLSEDLYRLVMALAPFADMESIDGTLALAVDCGLIQLETEMKLSDMKKASEGQIDPEQLQALPEMLGWLCMEGNISCTSTGDAYVYSLELEKEAMQQLVNMILPKLSQFGGNLTEGNAGIILENGAVSSMNVSIAGEISVLITQIPITVEARFFFD